MDHPAPKSFLGRARNEGRTSRAARPRLDLGAGCFLPSEFFSMEQPTKPGVASSNLASRAVNSHVTAGAYGSAEAQLSCRRTVRKGPAHSASVCGAPAKHVAGGGRPMCADHYPAVVS